MAASRLAVRSWGACAALVLAAFPLAAACSTADDGAIKDGPSLSGSSTGMAGSNVGGAGTNPTAGATSSAGGASGGTSVGGAATAGTATGGAATAGTGTGGNASAGSGVGGATAGAAGSGGLEAGDTPPVRPLNVMASKGEHVHGKAGMDTRATKMLGKLVVDLGVNAGGYSSFLAKRGYHSMGAPCGSCPAPDLGGSRTRVGDCRMQEFATTEASVKQQLTSLHAQYPEEDWGYFLNADGSVRWSDVALTGISHGATTAAIAGRIGARMWRIVSRSGPRDNTCGSGNGQCTAPITTPSYDANCPDADVAAWLDQPSKTPMNRFYGIVGMTDGQCGDIMFNMKRTGYVGTPVIFDNAAAVLTGTNQFFSMAGGHYDFLAAPGGVMRTPEVLNIAFGIPPENQNPAF
jgi:hypothetical protein